MSTNEMALLALVGFLLLMITGLTWFAVWQHRRWFETEDRLTKVRLDYLRREVEALFATEVDGDETERNMQVDV